MQILLALKTLFSQEQCADKCPKLMGRCDAKDVPSEGLQEKDRGEEEAFFYLNDFGF